jgi:hypothetical protein
MHAESNRYVEQIAIIKDWLKNHSYLPPEMGMIKDFLLNNNKKYKRVTNFLRKDSTEEILNALGLV